MVHVGVDITIVTNWIRSGLANMGMILDGLLYIFVGIVVCFVICLIGGLIDHIKEQDWFIGIIAGLQVILIVSSFLMVVYAFGYVAVNIGKAMFF